MSNKKIRPLRSKLAVTIITVVFLALLGVGAVVLLNTRKIAKTLMDSNRQMSLTSRSVSSSSMESLNRVRMQELAEDKAELADRTFYEFRQAVTMVAAAAEKLYADPDAYPGRDVSLPDASKDGELTVQLLFATGIDPEDSAIAAEARLIGNLQEMLYAVNLQNDSIASIYFASESGIMVQADWISGKKFDEAGKIMPLDAKDRAWYKGAKETGDIFLTPVTRDLHTPRMAVMCGVPVWHEGKLMGVAGAGMYLDSIEQLVESVDLGDKGNICIVNSEGQILFSNFQEGSLSIKEAGEDLRESQNDDLGFMTRIALNGVNGVKQLSIDGAPCYVAFAPMKTVGWSIFVVLAKDEIDAATLDLQKGLERIAEDSENAAAQQARKAIILLLSVFAAALLVALIASVILANRVVRPINQLTDEVSRVKGEDLDFKWDKDTGDETQLLAEAFQSLTGRMKTYVSDIEKITAERERIGTELELATRIQSDMLPGVFPAFPNRKDFDIFASMTPAKEVGGDFYDFFLIDEDHLALVIADVSGKGVPAALFMMVSMILIRSEVKNGLSPAKVLQKINDQICAGNQEDMFVTVWLGILDLKTGKLTAANAGHEYPTLKQPGGSFELIKEPHGFVVGGLPGEEYEEYEWQLQPGAKIFVYTDGVPEAGGSRSALYGTDRMMEALRAAENESPEKILEAVDAAVRDYVGDAPQFDDVTMLCVEYKGTTGEDN
ncbi:MAG: SpoIIE family protein phosphatase [Lachnospiraceae bacterium]|nr:SpoIIE family protein phosphatase [Lachnospiraceae bacterium]